RIEARVERRGEKVAIAVADTGPGLSESELALAFEPFGRIERTGAGVAGAGLGLPLSRRLAELMGGELLAKSAQGVGSCFTLVLPYDPDSPRPAARESDEARPRGALKVLLSDDDPLSAAMLRKCLEELGHQVAQCRGRERLIDLARGLPFDLVVLRLAEDEDPHQQIALLRRSGERLAAIPLVLAAGGPEAARARGAADAVLRLPASLPSLARAVAEALAAPAERVAFDEGDSSAA
ncbi:MAG: ATP-binding protein, partial [Caulobacteraceae bacterium]